MPPDTSAADAKPAVIADAKTEPQPNTETKAISNPFLTIAMLLESVANSLEGVKNTGQPPRWVRIVRVRQFSGDTIANGVSAAVGGLATAIAYIHRFTLQARDLLIQGDAAKALFEVSAKFLETATTDEFYNALQAGIGVTEPNSSNPLKAAGGAIDFVSKIVDKVPSAEDLDVIGKQLYRMLNIEQLPASETAVANLHVDIDKTGKLRLIQWGLAKEVATFLLLKSITEVNVTRLGTRRIPATGSAPGKSLAKWAPAPAPGETAKDTAEETVFEFDFSKNSDDFVDISKLLKGLNYLTDDVSSYTADLKTALETFQTTNGLSKTGLLDNSTINRMLNLDYESKNVKKALPAPAK